MRLSRFLSSCLPAVLLLAFSLPALLAQTNTTALNGVVYDPSGAVIQGATITILDASKGATKTLVSSSKGEFEFAQIQPGHYTLTVSASGFSNQQQELELLVASPLKVTVRMTVGATTTVSVDAAPEAINTSDATLGKPFDSQEIQNLPYLADNVLSLLSLQPGVQSLDPGSKTVGINQDSRTGVVNGARQDQSNVTLDGVDDNDQNNGYAFNGVLRSTRDSVEEFRVVTSNPNADSGRSSGAQVSLVTRSGSNALHGSAYEYYRDPGVASNDWFLKQGQLASDQPNVAAKILQHTFGASFGAPIKKDKLFFFGAYEGFKQASDTVVTNQVPSVINPMGGFPTVNGYGGLITQTVSYLNTSGTYSTLNAADIAKMDPNCTSTGACPNGPGVDADAIAYFNQFPLANSNNGGDNINTGGYIFASPAPASLITNIARLDYNVTPRQTLFVRGNLQADNILQPEQFPGGPANSSQYSNGRGIAAGHIWTISNALTNNIRYGYIRQDDAVRGATDQPYVSFDAVTNLTSTDTSTIFKVPVHNIIDDATWIKGRHTIQFGINDRFISNYRYADFTLYPTGDVTADLLATAAIAGKGTSLDPGAFTNVCADCKPVDPSFSTFYNQAIIGIVGGITYASQYLNYKISGNSLVPLPGGTVPTRHYASKEQEYYVQDSFKATPHLTLTAGLRYSYLGVPYETTGQEVAPTISLQNFLANREAAAYSGAAAAGNAYNTRISVTPAGSANHAPNLWTPQKTNFAPRFSFAYSTPNGRSVIRGGFGIVYDHFGTGIIDNYDANGAFTLNTQYVSNYSSVDTAQRFTGYHDVPVPSITASTQAFPITPADQNFSFVNSIDNKLKTPYAETFNLTVQHEIKAGLSLTATYVGRLGRHVMASLDVAAPSNVYDPGSSMTYFQAITAIDKLVDQGLDPSAVPTMKYWQDIFPNFSFGGYTGTQAIYASIAAGDRGNETDTLYNNDLNPASAADGASTFRFFYPQYSSIYVQSSVANSSYNALQLSVRQEMKYGLAYDFNYTLGHSFDWGSDPERKAGNGWNPIINTFNPSQMYAPSDYDIRHNVTANYIFAMPFGRGGHLLSTTNRVVDSIIGGWTLDGLVHYSSSLPFSAHATYVYGTNFANESWMVQTGKIASGGHHYIPGAEGTEVAWKDMTTQQVLNNLRFAYPGETGQRNNFRGDGYFTLDNGLSKSFNIYHEQKLKLSVEVFNLLNDVRFNTQTAGGVSVNSTTTNGSSTLFGQYASLLVQPRQMQFSAKYSF